MNNRTRSFDNRKAIMIGITKYESDPVIPQLAGAENDAKELYNIFRNYGNFEISNNHHLLGPDATRKNILRTIGEVFQKDFKYDLILLYFSGHGMVDEITNEVYLAPYDMDPECPSISGISLRDLKKVIYTSKHKASVIIILDCCYAGIVTKDTKMAPQEQEKKRNLFAINVEKMMESSDQGQGKIVLASNETTAASREKNVVYMVKIIFHTLMEHFLIT